MAYLMPGSPDDATAGWSVVGYATVGGSSATFHATPGALRGTTVELDDLLAGAADRLATPSPG